MEVAAITTAEELARAVDMLVAREPRFRPVVTRSGYPPLRHAEPGLKTLLRIVTDQLISLKAGAAIWQRLEVLLDGFEPDVVLAAPVDTLKACGLSTAKALAFHAAARAAQDGLLGPAGLARLDDRDAVAALCAIRGIGPWTADIYLLAALGRRDAWPAGDLALQVAAHDLIGLAQRPDARAMRSLAEPWRPMRAAAARLLWSHYRSLKQMPQLPI